MLNFPKWKIGLVLAVLLAGFVWVTPSLLPRDVTDRLPAAFQPINLGLDLQGGSYLLLEVDSGYVIKEKLTSLVEGIRTVLRKQKVKYADLGIAGKDSVRVRLLDGADLDAVRSELRQLDPDAAVDVNGATLVFSFGEKALNARIQSAVDQSIEIVRRRVDELGTREPSIQKQGIDRIVVQLPGVRDPGRIKALIGKTAKLTFHIVDDTVSPEEAAKGRLPPGSMLLPATEGDPYAPAYVVRKKVEVSGDMLVDSQASYNEGRPVVSFRFSAAGGKRFGDTTRENNHKALAIVLDGKVISAPRINEPILGGSGIITGQYTVQEAQDLALLLRAGALPAPLNVLEERSVGPDLGADSIRAGIVACLLGLALVIVSMIAVYGMLGVIANIALVLNLVLLMALLAFTGATLTLPGIAGIVLTMGMAVDANILIYERIREETRAGRGLYAAVQTGFERAFATIVDANLTTIAAALLLFALGGGPVRGFAVTLGLGLMSSMFTAIMVTRLMVILWIRWRRPTRLLA